MDVTTESARPCPCRELYAENGEKAWASSHCKSRLGCLIGYGRNENLGNSWRGKVNGSLLDVMRWQESKMSFVEDLCWEYKRMQVTMQERSLYYLSKKKINDVKFMHQSKW